MAGGRQPRNRGAADRCILSGLLLTGTGRREFPTRGSAVTAEHHDPDHQRDAQPHGRLQHEQPIMEQSAAVTLPPSRRGSASALTAAARSSAGTRPTRSQARRRGRPGAAPHSLCEHNTPGI
jgi:hypothetical protein